MKYSLLYPNKEIPQKAWRDLMKEVAEEAKLKADNAKNIINKAIEDEIALLKRRIDEKSN